jgi:hypothetical protein
MAQDLLAMGPTARKAKNPRNGPNKVCGTQNSYLYCTSELCIAQFIYNVVPRIYENAPVMTLPIIVWFFPERWWYFSLSKSWSSGF